VGLFKIQRTEIQSPVHSIENVFSVAPVNIIQYTAQSATRVGIDIGNCKTKNSIAFYLSKTCHWHNVNDDLDWRGNIFPAVLMPLASTLCLH
jgi:hypothetical protein